MIGQWRTPQEAFWSGDFGDEYIERSSGPELVAIATRLWAEILSSTGRIGSAIEFGPNVGNNLRALRQLRPNIELTAVEINERAVAELERLEWVDVRHGSFLDPHAEGTFDLAFCCGVLIHIAPEALSDAYDRLHAASRRYVLISEYYNPTPVAIPYRGHDDRLFKRDFAGELLDRFDDLRLVDYGFRYRRDTSFPGDDVNWFLLEKQPAVR
ncbi:MAG: pseudaminic acid biosynthesis-associated methylase [Actinomycetota bacterium]